MSESDTSAMELAGFDSIRAVSDFTNTDSPFSRAAALLSRPLHSLTPLPEQSGTGAFYQEGDPICRIEIESGIKGAIGFDHETVQVEKKDRTLFCTARSDGYLVYDGVMKLVSPFLRPDKYSIVFRNIPVSFGREALISAVASLCRRHRERYADPGVELTHPEAAQELVSNKPGDHLLVKGIVPEEGRNAAVKIMVSEDLPVTEGVEAVDYRQFHRYIVCAKDQLLVLKKKASSGITGVDIHGDEVPVKAGTDLPFRAGENARVEEGEDEIRYFAALGGRVHLKDTAVSVSELMSVDHDVDLSTGNIVYEKDVVIKGSVKAGFSVLCGGDLFIQGVVEPGAQITCKGSLTAGGAVGDSTIINVHKDAVFGYIQDAKVYCEGDIRVLKGCMHARIFSCGNLLVEGKKVKEGKSAIIGGSAGAMKLLHCPSVGSLLTDTSLCAGYNPYAEASLHTIEEAVHALEIRISALIGELGVDPDLSSLREKLQTMLPAQKSLLKRKLLELKKSTSKREELLVQKELRRKQIYQEDVKLLRIEVARHLVPRVEVRMLNEQVTLNDAAASAAFLLKEGKIVKIQLDDHE
jgi:uncharacterized protein